MIKSLLFLLLLIPLDLLYGQSDSLRYNPHDFFAGEFQPPAGNAFRSANGSPGPMYWQNASSYLIHAALSESDTTIRGDETIYYTNNSPDKLDYVWLQLDQ